MMDCLFSVCSVMYTHPHPPNILGSWIFEVFALEVCILVCRQFCD